MMSKQVRFVHDEEDALLFLKYLQNISVGIVDASGPLSLDLSMDKIVQNMNSFGGQYYIYPQNTEGLMASGQYSDVLYGFAVEFSNSYKGNALSRNYECGRLYIHPTEDGTYEPAVLDLFSQLAVYIKKNYHFSKNERLYCGKSLEAHIISRKKNATVNGKIVSIL